MNSRPDWVDYLGFLLTGGAIHLGAIATQARLAWAFLRPWIQAPPRTSRLVSSGNPDCPQPSGQDCQEVAR